MGEIRIPIKKTAIEKKNRIIKMGFELMCEEGYFNVSCIDIAARANVSTGIIYQYFKDKKDIFICGIDSYADEILFPILNILEDNELIDSRRKNILSDIIDKLIQSHWLSKKAHEELMAMVHIDKEIASIFCKMEIEITEKIIEKLKNKKIIVNDTKEKIHIIIGVVENFCHEVVYHQHENINYDLMKEEVMKIVLYLLND
jgi:Transcriptional regulator